MDVKRVRKTFRLFGTRQARVLFGLGFVLFVLGCSDGDVKMTSLSSLSQVTRVDFGVSNPLDEGAQGVGGAFRFSGTCRTQVTGFKVKLGEASEILIPTSNNSYPDFTSTSYQINKVSIANNSLIGTQSYPSPSIYEGEYFPDSVPLPFDLDCRDGRFDFYLFKSTMEWLYSGTSDFPAGIDRPSKVSITPVIPNFSSAPVVFYAPSPSKLKLEFHPDREDPVLAQATTFVPNQSCSTYNNHGCVIFKLQLASADGSEAKAIKNYHFNVVVKNSADQIVSASSAYFQILPGSVDAGYAAILNGEKELIITLKTALAGGSLIPVGEYKLVVSDRDSELPTVVKEFVVRKSDSVNIVKYSGFDSAYRVPLAKGLYYLNNLSFEDIEEGPLALLSSGDLLIADVLATNLGSASVASVFGAKPSSSILSIGDNGGAIPNYTLPMDQQNYMLLKFNDNTSGQSKKIEFSIKSQAPLLSKDYEWAKWPSFDIMGSGTYASTYSGAGKEFWYADHNIAYQTGHPIIYNLNEVMPASQIAMSHINPDPSPRGRCYELRLARGTADDAILYSAAMVNSFGAGESAKNMSLVKIKIRGSKYLGGGGWSSETSSGLKFFNSYSSCQDWNDTATGQSLANVLINYDTATSSTIGAYYQSIYMRYEFPSGGSMPIGGKVKVVVQDYYDSAKSKEYILYLKGGD